MRLASLILLLLIARASSFPEEENDNPELYESDMRLTPMQRLLAETRGDVALASLGMGRASAKDMRRLWLPQKRVAYTITEDLVTSADATWGLTQAFRDWETKTCLKFEKRTDDKDYIEFIKASGCWSYVGRQGGKQNVSLGYGCYTVGTVVHEIGHAIGFWHEQSRPDRDQFIKVVWDNVPQKKRHNFRFYNNSIVDSLNTPYDYLSVMQYSKTAFGSGNVTMQPLQPGVFQLGQRVGLSATDAYQARQLYQCQGATTRPQHKRRIYQVRGYHGCNFDQSMCHFKNDFTADFNWKRRVGKTPSSNTGPKRDHTTGDMGAYMFVEASYPQERNDTARLLSKSFSATSLTCLTFFYSMYADRTDQMGTMNVLLKEFGPTGNVSLLLSKSGSQGRGWKYARVQFKSDALHQLVFEGIRGRTYQGDIAIDDISITPGRCPNKVPEEPMPCVDEYCEDTSDREGEYCQLWKDGGKCSSEERLMRKYCPKTCGFCKTGSGELAADYY